MILINLNSSVLILHFSICYVYRLLNRYIFNFNANLRLYFKTLIIKNYFEELSYAKV